MMSVLNRIISFVRKLYNTIYYNIGSKDDFIILRSWVIQWGKKICHCNYGDDLNFFLISKLSGKKVLTTANFLHKKNINNFMCIGSLVEYASSSIVWGSGALYGDVNKFQPKPLKVCAVRGPLTRKYLLSLGVECPEIYGDPALLLPYVYNPSQLNGNKKWRVGIIPHIADKNNSLIKEYVKLNSDNSVIIRLDKYKSWTDVIDKINNCSILLSSSLHGLIISDAYGIPNVWIKLSEKVEGNGFKFQDYFKSVKRNEGTPIEINETSDFTMAITKALDYKQIEFDCKPLLNSCPFKILTELYDDRN